MYDVDLCVKVCAAPPTVWGPGTAGIFCLLVKLWEGFEAGPSSRCNVGGGGGRGSVFISTGDNTGDVASSDSIFM